MKNVFIIILIFYSNFILGQDLITTKSGQVFKGKITQIDSTKIVFELLNGNKTFGLIKSIESFKIYDQIFHTKDLSSEELTDFIKKLRAKLIKPEPTIALADSLDRQYRNFIYFYNNQIIYGDFLNYKKTILGPNKIELDGVKYSLMDIKFIKKNDDFYANSQRLNPFSENLLAIRISKGNINLYQREVHRYRFGGPTYKTIFNYYNKGLGDLKIANYKNLYLDLNDNPESMMHLNKYKNTQTLQNSFMIGGLSLVAVGLITLVNKTKNYDGKETSPEPNVTANIATICVGSIAFGGAYLVSLSKPKHLKNAIDAYNQ